jgi:hypothetical protein
MAVDRNTHAPPPVQPQPSGVVDAYWLFATRACGAYPPPTVNSGKWLVFVPRSAVDALWATIKAATESGLLGDSAKVSTARPNPNAREPDQHVICIYTYDWTDQGDVRRVRQTLRDLGVVRKIPYKADQETLAGKYAVRGSRRISKYYA